MQPQAGDGRYVIGNLTEVFDTVIMQFEASVYQGTGEEKWKGVLCRHALEGAVPNTDSIWSTSLQRSANYPATFKAKINLLGDRAAKFYDVADETAERPSNWKRLPCNAVLQVRGCYLQRQSLGLLLEKTHLQHGTERSDAERGSPF